MNRKNSCEDAPLSKVRARRSTSVTTEKSRCERVSPTIAGHGRQGSFVGVSSRAVAGEDTCPKIASRVPGALCS